MRIVSNIPATFVSKRMELFTVGQGDVGKAVEAPDWVKDTLLFKMREDIVEAPEETESPEEPEAPEEPEEEPAEKPAEKPQKRYTKKKG